MKTLLDCKKADKLKVTRLNAQPDLKQRLISFGIMKDSKIEVLELAPAKKTIEIKVGKMRVALRDQEAAMIEVDEL